MNVRSTSSPKLFFCIRKNPRIFTEKLGLRMLGRRQVMPRGDNYPVCGFTTELDRRVDRGGYGHPPQTEIRRKSEKGGAG